MATYTFQVILDDVTEMTEDLAEALVAAGCDDGMPGSSDGVASVLFDRQADCFEQALRSAITDVTSAPIPSGGIAPKRGGGRADRTAAKRRGRRSPGSILRRRGLGTVRSSFPGRRTGRLG